MPKIIINADDFGKDEMTTKAIAESFRKGYINQTTLMVNMPYADQAVAIARKEGFADKVGLHLNLTERSGGGKLVVPINSADLRKEMRSQIEKYLSYNLSLMHCDSHHHVHFRLHVAFVLLPLLRQYGFRTIRRPYNIGLHFTLGGIFRRMRNGIFRMSCVVNLIKATDWFGALRNGNALQDVEYMVHPIYDKYGVLINCTCSEEGTGPLMSECTEVL